MDVLNGGGDTDNDPEKKSNDKAKDLQASLRGKAIAAFVLYGLFIYGDLEVIWPVSHFWGSFMGAAASISLLYLEAYATKAIGLFVFWLGGVVIAIVAASFFFILPEDKPFSVSTTIPIWSRDFKPFSRERKFFTFAVSKGFLRILDRDDDNSGIEIDLLINFDVTNVSSFSRRITSYRLAVAESRKGPWTFLCPIYLREPHRIYTVTHPNPGGFFELIPRQYFDQNLSAKPMMQGESVAGTTLWVCPQGAKFDCRPIFMKIVISDSLGSISEYIQDREALLGTKPDEIPHDWMADGNFTPAIPSRGFPFQPAAQASCGLGSGPIK